MVVNLLGVTTTVPTLNDGEGYVVGSAYFTRLCLQAVRRLNNFAHVPPVGLGQMGLKWTAGPHCWSVVVVAQGVMPHAHRHAVCSSSQGRYPCNQRRSELPVKKWEDMDLWYLPIFSQTELPVCKVRSRLSR